MKEQDDDRIRALLRQSVPPLADTEPRHDLWFAMTRRMKEHRAPHWFDWVLACSAVVIASSIPAAVPILMYCL